MSATARVGPKATPKASLKGTLKGTQKETAVLGVTKRRKGSVAGAGGGKVTTAAAMAVAAVVEAAVERGEMGGLKGETTGDGLREAWGGLKESPGLMFCGGVLPLGPAWSKRLMFLTTFS